MSTRTFLDELVGSMSMGAVNCVVRRGEAMIGENTDGKGFLKSLETVIEPRGKTVVLFGAGGAARAIAVEFRDRNIRCNAVCPGFVRTPHGLREVAELQRYGVDVSEAALAAQQGRICEPEEVARAALFLASDDASFVNGTHLFVDNGFTAA